MTTLTNQLIEQSETEQYTIKDLMHMSVKEIKVLFEKYELTYWVNSKKKYNARFLLTAMNKN